MEKSVVEWLAKELESYGDPQVCEITWQELDLLVEQANQIFKEQIIKTWDKRGETIVPRYFLEENISGDQYYEKTFNSEQNDKT